METKRYRQVNYAKLTLDLKVNVKYKSGLSIMKATHTGSVIGSDVDEVVEVSKKVKYGIIEKLRDIFKLKPTEGLIITSMEIIHHQGVTTYKI